MSALAQHAPAWTGVTVVLAGARVTPTVVAPLTTFYADPGGTTGASEPTWPTADPWTVVDGTVTWHIGTSFRQQQTAGVLDVITDFRDANPTLLKGVKAARPKSGTNIDQPAAWIGPRQEAVTHAGNMRITTVTVPVTVTCTPTDNGEAEAAMDVLMDGLRDAFTLAFHAASGYSITTETAASDVDLPEGVIPYLAQIIIVTSTITEGRT